MASMGGGIFARGEVKESSIQAVVTRADGRIENLGTIAYYHRNPIRRAWGDFTIFLNDLRRAAVDGWNIGRKGARHGDG